MLEVGRVTELPNYPPEVRITQSYPMPEILWFFVARNYPMPEVLRWVPEKGAGYRQSNFSVFLQILLNV